MLCENLISFCHANNIILFEEPVNVTFLTYTKPNPMGFLIGYSVDDVDEIAVILGPEIPKVFIVSKNFLIDRINSFASTRKLKI